MTGGMPRRRYDLESSRDADPSGHRHVRQLGDVPIHPREVRFALREREVLALNDEGGLRERAVVAGVIEVQVAIHDNGDVGRTNSQRGEPRNDRVLFCHDHLQSSRPERRIGPFDVDRVETGVEEDVALGRPYETRPDRDEGLVVGGPWDERGSADRHASGPKERELDRVWRARMTAWPRPRAISHRLTGNAATNARASDSARLPQSS